MGEEGAVGVNARRKTRIHLAAAPVGPDEPVYAELDPPRSWYQIGQKLQIIIGYIIVQLARNRPLHGDVQSQAHADQQACHEEGVRCLGAKIPGVPCVRFEPQRQGFVRKHQLGGKLRHPALDRHSGRLDRQRAHACTRGGRTRGRGEQPLNPTGGDQAASSKECDAQRLKLGLRYTSKFVTNS